MFKTSRPLWIVERRAAGAGADSRDAEGFVLRAGRSHDVRGVEDEAAAAAEPIAEREGCRGEGGKPGRRRSIRWTRC